MDNIFSEMRRSDEEMAAAKAKEKLQNSRSVDNLLNKIKKVPIKQVTKLSVNDIEEIYYNESNNWSQSKQ